MNRLLSWISLVFLLVHAGCESGKIRPETVQMQIGAHREDCTGVGPMKCLLVKEGENTDWQLFYSEIEGFAYEEGYEYKIVVRKENIPNPPADGSSIRYVLVREIEKIKE